MDGLDSRWRSYFGTRQGGEPAADRPEAPSATIDLVELYSADPELAQAVLDRPARVLEAARSALRAVTGSAAPVRLRVENNPHLCGVGEVTARHLHDLVTVRGAVETVDPVGAVPVRARYRCPACDETRETTPDGLEPTEPARCDGCGRRGGFEFQPAASAFVDARPITLAATDEDGSERPDGGSLRAYVYGDLVDAAAEGDHVGVTGILRAREREGTPLWERYLDGLGVRAEREISPPTTLADTLDSHWDPG